MREVHIAPGVVATVMVEEDVEGRRVLLRIGNGRHRPLRPLVADALGDLLKQAAAECRAVPADQMRPTIERPSGIPRVEDFAPGPRVDARHHQV